MDRRKKFLRTKGQLIIICCKGFTGPQVKKIWFWVWNKRYVFIQELVGWTLRSMLTDFLTFTQVCYLSIAYISPHQNKHYQCNYLIKYLNSVTGHIQDLLYDSPPLQYFLKWHSRNISSKIHRNKIRKWRQLYLHEKLKTIPSFLLKLSSLSIKEKYIYNPFLPAYACYRHQGRVKTERSHLALS